MTDQNIEVVFEGVDMLTGAVRNMTSALAGMGKTVAGVGQQVGRSQGFLSSFASTLGGFVGGIGAVNAISAAVGFAGNAFIGLNSTLEQSEVAFGVMLGSAEAATAHLDELAAFAAKTPFEFPELIGASKRLQAYGFEAARVVPILTDVSDAAAATGGSVDSITLALGQMQAAGKARTGEINQLINQGIPMWEMLADTMGITVAEAMKKVELGQVDVATAMEAFETGVGSRYGGMAAKQSKTFQGAMSTVMDTLNMTLAKGFRPFFDMLTTGMVGLGEFLGGEQFTAFATSVAETGASLGHFVAEDAIPAIIRIVQTFGKVVGSVIPTVVGAFTSLINIGKLLVTRDFTGGIFGLEEDSPWINALFVGRDAVVGLIETVGDLVGVFTQLPGVFSGSVESMANLAAGLDRIFGPGVAGPALDFLSGLRDGIGHVVSVVSDLIGYFGSGNEIDVMRNLFGDDAGPRIDEIVRGFSGLLSSIGDVASIIASFVTGGTDLTGMLDGLGAAAGKAFENLGQIGGQLGQWLLDAIGSIDWGPIGETINTGLSSALATVTGIGQSALDLGASILTAAQSIDWGPIGEAINSGLSTALGIVTGIGESALDLGASILTSAQSIDWGPIGEAINVGLATALETITGIGESALDLGSSILTAAQGIEWGPIGEAINVGTAGALETAGNIGDSVVTWLTGAWATIDKTDWGAIWGAATGVGEGLLSLATGIGASVSLFLTTAWGTVNATNWGAIWAAATGIGEGLLSLAAGIGTSVFTFLTTAWATITAIEWGAIWRGAVGIGEGFVAGAAAIYESIKGWLIGQFQMVDWTMIWANIQRHGEDLVTSLSTISLDLQTWLVIQFQGVNWVTVWAGVEGIGRDFAIGVPSISLDIEGWLIASLRGVNTADATAQSGIGARFGIDLVAAFEGVDWSLVGASVTESVLDAITASLAVGKSIQEMSDGFANTLNTAFSSINWNERLGKLSEDFGNALKGILFGVVALSLVKDAIDEFTSGIVDTLALRLGTFLGEKALEFGKMVYDNVVIPIKNILGIGSPSTVFMAIGTDIIQGLIDGITSLAENLSTRAGSAVTNAIAAAQTAVTGVLEVGASIVQGVMDGITSLAENLSTRAGSAVTNAIAAAASAVVGVIEIGASMVMGMIDGVTSMVTAFNGQAAGVVVGAIAAAQAAVAGVIAIGESIVSGIISGVTSKAKELATAAAGLVTDALGAARAAIEGHSPARAFIPVGESMVQGLMAGMDNESANLLEDISRLMGEAREAFERYIDAIILPGPAQGDWLNDWLTHIPEGLRGLTEDIGRYFAQIVENGDVMGDMLSALPPRFQGIFEEIGRHLVGSDRVLDDWTQHAGYAFGYIEEKLVEFRTANESALPVVSSVIDSLAGKFDSLGVTVAENMAGAADSVTTTMEEWQVVLNELAEDTLPSLLNIYNTTQRSMDASTYEAVSSMIEGLQDLAEQGVSTFGDTFPTVFREFYDRTLDTLDTLYRAAMGNMDTYTVQAVSSMIAEVQAFSDKVNADFAGSIPDSMDVAVGAADMTNRDVTNAVVELSDSIAEQMLAVAESIRDMVEDINEMIASIQTEIVTHHRIITTTEQGETYTQTTEPIEGVAIAAAPVTGGGPKGGVVAQIAAAAASMFQGSAPVTYVFSPSIQAGVVVSAEQDLKPLVHRVLEEFIRDNPRLHLGDRSYG